MTKTILNPLPAPTWNRLGVNPANISLPEIPAKGWGESSTRVDAPIDSIQLECPGFSALESGGGADLGRFLRENANFHLHLAVKEGTEGMILIQHTLEEDHPHAIAHLSLRARPHSKITVIEVIRGGVSGSIHGSLAEIQAGEKAEVTLIQLQMLSAATRSWSAVSATAGENAQVCIYRAALGGSSVLSGGKCLLPGTGSAFEARTIYYGDGDTVLDFSDTAVHTGRKTRSEIHAAGVLDGNCQKTLRGTIDFRRGAVQGVGHESEDVLLLSPDVRNRTAPLILCGEEQVEGQHAASIGRLDEAMLYYMASRGIGEGEARRLLALAKFAPVLDALPPDLRCEAESYLERRLPS